MMCENISLPKIEETKDVSISKQNNDIDPNLPKIDVKGRELSGDEVHQARHWSKGKQIGAKST